MFDLRADTDQSWLETVRADLGAFLADHAACERKASATALSFVVRYPDRTELVESMIQVAQEELDHFAQVAAIIHGRGERLRKDVKDPYVNALLKLVRGPSEERLLDRLLLFGIMEGRGCERFGILSRGLDDPALRDFYAELVLSEARHHAAFHHLVRLYCPEEVWRPRMAELLDAEAEILRGLALRPALH
jgi:tRNA 2-(methylsulfanyl)-N6-isopentenyladenosine37 hydroxylase